MRHRFVWLIGLVLWPLLVVDARGDTADSVRQRGALRWGGDREGGGPYIYQDPEHPDRLTGFEVDLMQALAERLKVRSEFRQCDWKQLPDLLRRGDIEVVVNGYELTPVRLRSMIATAPYYVYELQLLARRDDPAVRSWDDLKKAHPGGKWKIGVMDGTSAEKYVRQNFVDTVEIEHYDGSTDAMKDVESGRLDGTVQDLPAAVFYEKRFTRLHFVDRPAGRGYYVMYLRPGEDRLRDELNEGIRALLASGELRAIYQRYHLWNPAQDELPGLMNQTPAALAERAAASTGRESVPTGSWTILHAAMRMLLKAAGLTVLLSCAAMPLAVLAGLLIAIGRLYGPWPLRTALGAYVEVLRGTPLLFQLLTIYYVLPAFHILLYPIWAGILGLAMNYSAYESEIYRAGLLAIPAGQMEAALSLGMSRITALRRIIVPQAVRLVVPPVANDFIALFKDTSLCSAITIVELTKQYLILVNDTGAYLELAVATAALYLLMSYPLSLLTRRLERRVPKVVA